MDESQKSLFLKAALASRPKLSGNGSEHLDLIYDVGIDIDSFEEFLAAMQEALKIKFAADFSTYFPGWFSPFELFRFARRSTW